GRRRASHLEPAIHYATLDFVSPLKGLEAAQEFKPDFVIHLACPPDQEASPESEHLFGQWAAGSVDFLSAMSQVSSVKAFLVAGSVKEYGTGSAPFGPGQALMPVSAYGAAKASVSAFASYFRQIRRLNTVVLRLATVYGPGQSQGGIIDAACRALRQKSPLRMTAGEQVREFLYIDDAARAIVLALVCAEHPEAGALTLGGHKPVKLIDLVKCLMMLEGGGNLVQAGALPYRASEVFDMRVDSSLFGKLTGWSPCVSIEEGLRRTWQWYCSHA
ncbi:MAG: NAD(P)-dependent oxidoreductase, partial [Elusimicrobiota bacterium]